MVHYIWLILFSAYEAGGFLEKLKYGFVFNFFKKKEKLLQSMAVLGNFKLI